MSLGSIAHLQYYFARTGLLDGKGGQLAKKKHNGEYDIPRLSLRGDQEFSESPVDEEGQALWEAVQEEGEDIMLPPTVSTYSDRSQYVAPPPDQKTLKRQLVETLENALQAVESCEKLAAEDDSPSQGFHELQGMQILDTTTQAIRAARLYYTLHPYPKRIHAIRSDQQLRKDLYSVLEVLKKCAARNFDGGFREDERLSILVWVSEVGMMIDQEAKLEEKERRERKDWQWMDDYRWYNNEDARDLNFLHFLQRKARPEVANDQPSTFAEYCRMLADGRDLAQMHNIAVKESKHRFHLIETFHQDINKPYRRAENLRYWVKAAELRFELKLRFDVIGIAQLRDDTGLWSTFEKAVRLWAQAVRMELTKDWNGDEERKIHARAKSLASIRLGTPNGSPSKSNPGTPPVPRLPLSLAEEV